MTFYRVYHSCYRVPMTLHKTYSSIIGLVQSAIVLAYVFLFAGAIHVMSEWHPYGLPDGPLVIVPLFLMIFIFSALVCGGAILGYPLILLFEKKTARAVSIVCWSAFWFAVFIGIAVAVGSMFAIQM